MNISAIAKVVLNHRRRPSAFINSGELRQQLDMEAYQEALARRWIIPDYETGYLSASNSATVIQEIEHLAELEKPLEIGDTVVVADNGQSITGAVKEIRPDGRVVVSFGATKPTSGKLDYAPTEVKRQSSPAAAPSRSTAPATPAEPPPVGTAHP